MKKLLMLFFISGLIISCSDSQLEKPSDFETQSFINISTRNANNWCDGGQSDPPVAQIVGYSETTPGLCCINYQYNDEYSTAQTARIMLTEYDFYQEKGDPWNNFMYFEPVVFDDILQICIPEAYGSHFAIELYSGTCSEEDGCLGYLGCNSFDIPCW